MSVSVTYEAETYATVEDVRAQPGTPDGVTDAQILDALMFATELVNRRAGQQFGPITSQKIYDVRTDSVVLNTNGAITSVKVGDSVMDPNTYEVMPWGVRFVAPPGGVFFDPYRPLTVEPIRSWWSHGRGVTVTVEGSFGDAVSPLIKRATIMLALADFPATESDSLLDGLPENVKSLSVEGLSLTLSEGSGLSSSSSAFTTGNATADRLIDLALSRGPFVA